MWACSRYEGKRNANIVLVAKPGERDNYEDPGIEGRMESYLVLKKQDGLLWTG